MVAATARGADMSYRAGIGPGMAALGLQPGEPHIVCDGCGCTHEVSTRTSIAAVWFLKDRSPPRWGGHGHGTPSRRDYCPECITTQEAHR